MSTAIEIHQSSIEESFYVPIEVLEGLADEFERDARAAYPGVTYPVYDECAERIREIVNHHRELQLEQGPSSTHP
jgi:hypothetical protein